MLIAVAFDRKIQHWEGRDARMVRGTIDRRDARSMQTILKFLQPQLWRWGNDQYITVEHVDPAMQPDLQTNNRNVRHFALRQRA